MSIDHDRRYLGFETACASVKPTTVLVLPVMWLSCWISVRDRRPATSEVPLLERSTPKTCMGVIVGILTICFVVSEILLLPVGWPPSWIFDRRQRWRRLSAVWLFRTQSRARVIIGNDTCIAETGQIISTSGNSAAILDLCERSTSGYVVSTANRNFDPENMGVAVGILSLRAVTGDMPGEIRTLRLTFVRHRAVSLRQRTLLVRK